MSKSIKQSFIIILAFSLGYYLGMYYPIVDADSTNNQLASQFDSEPNIGFENNNVELETI